MATLVQTSQNFWTKFFDYCTKSFQCLSKNPGLFLMRKLARIEWIRNVISFLYKLQSKSYTIDSGQDSVFTDINVDQMVSSINTDSYVAGINLPSEVIQEILNYAHSSPCYAERNPNLSFRYHQKEQAEASLGRQIRLGSYFHGQGCAAIRKLENDPKLLAIAAKFLGTAPVHVATELWWSFPVAGTSFEQLKAAQVFHYDLDDYRFIKFFFYLTDVDYTNGPHVLLRGSHKNKKLTHQLLGVRCASTDDQEILDCYGTENLVTVCGPAGLGFAEDSTCFHKGSLPAENERLLLQIEFAINSYGNIRDMAS
jgi:hypothetical protein